MSGHEIGGMMRYTAILAALAALALPSIAGAHAVGDWVLARANDGSSHLYPGVIKSISGTAITINYDDGTTETRPANQVRTYDWRIGSRISCVWTGDKKVYPAVITAMTADGASLTVRFPDDGTVQQTPTGACYSD